MSRHRPVSLAIVAVAAAASLLLSAGPAGAHGEEEEALAQAPARTLVQQAIGLLEQAEEPAEAAERLEAALESEDGEGVALASVRDALAALERDDHEEAAEHLNEALAPAETPEEPAEEHEEEGAVSAEAPPSSAEALSHTEEFEPGRGTEEWVGFAVGIVAIVLALALLAARRRTAAP